MEATTNNFVLARSKEHKFILETLGELESTLRLSESSEIIEKLKNIIEEFEKKVILHQELEEKIIFQAALEAMPSEKIVSLTLKLQKEHGIFCATLAGIRFKLWHLDFDSKLRVKLETELSQLTNVIKKHSLIEVKELFPIISNNPRCRQLIDKYSQTLG